MKRILVPLVAITFGDVMVRGWLLVITAFVVVGMLLVVRLQWKATKHLDRYNKQIAAQPDTEVIVIDDGAPSDAAASDVWVGLMKDGLPTGPRKKAKVLLDGAVRFIRPVYLPIPPDGYDEVAVWEDEQSFGGLPLVHLSPFLCAEETADGHVAIA